MSKSSKALTTVSVSRPTRIELVSGKGSGKKKKSKGRRRRGRSGPSGPSNSLTDAYMRTLVDPFDNPAPLMGFGDLTGMTSTTSFYTRGSVNANADGSLSLVAFPCSSGLLRINAAAHATATWTSVDSGSNAADLANFASGRIVSLGIRSYPDIAQTSVPGVVGCGILAGVQTPNQITAMTTDDFFAFPSTRIYKSLSGVSVTGRPIDLDSFIFYQNVIGTWGVGTSLPFAVPYVSYAGLPASAAVYYEVVANVETQPRLLHATAPVGNYTPSGVKTVSDEWPSIERLWAYLRPNMPPVGTPTEESATYWQQMRAAAAKGQRVAKGVRDVYGAGQTMFQTMNGLRAAFL